MISAFKSKKNQKKKEWKEKNSENSVTHWKRKEGMKIEKKTENEGKKSYNKVTNKIS